MSSILTNAYRLANGAVCIHLTGAAESDRVPVHFIAALDNSGSMEEQAKLKYVIQSLEALLNYMSDEDMLSLVIFESVVIRPFSFCKTTPDNKEMLRTYLRSLRPMGSTNLASAIANLHDVMAAAPPGYKHGVLLLTDGEATVGVRDMPTLLVHTRSLVAAYPQLTVATIGYGHDHNAELLRGIAEAGSSSYTLVTAVEHVASAFGDLLGGLCSCVAQEVKLAVPASATQLSLYSRRSDTQIFLGDLVAGGEHIIVLESIADSDVLQVTCSDVKTGVPMPPIPVGLHATTADEEQAGMRAFLRCSVVQAMEEVNRALQSGTIAAAPPTLRGRLEALLASVSTSPPHPLLDILRIQLERCITIVATPPPTAYAARLASHHLSQDTTYLGTARGALSSPEDPAAPPPPSLFATTVQRAMSSGMSSAVADTSYILPPPPASSSGVQRC